MIKTRIKTKFLIVILGISIISLLSFAAVTLLNMIQLGDQALESNSKLGETAASDSEQALKNQAQYYLLRLAEDQAAISNSLFEKVEVSVNIMAWHAQSLWNHYDAGCVKPKPSYSPDSKLNDMYAASVYKIAPDAVKEAIEQDIKISSHMDDIFLAIYPNDPNLKSIYLGTQNGLHRRYPWTAKRKKDYDPRKRNWYINAVKSDEIGWTDLYISASEEILMVTCYKSVYTKDKELIGVIGADVTLAALNKKIINTQIGDLGYAILIDKKGKVIASRELSKGDSHWDQRLKTENLLNSKNEKLVVLIKKMINGEKGIGKCKLKDGEKYIAYAPVKTTNWSLGIVMPVDEIIIPAIATKNKIAQATRETKKYTNQKIYTVNRMIFLIFVLIITLVTILAQKLSKTITSPISTLDQGAKLLGDGHLDHRLQIDTGDELEDLAGAFNKMAEDLKTYIKNLQETTAAKEKIESELKIAQEIQTSFLPSIFPPFPQRKDFDIFATMEPAKEVGGDFYDFFLIDEKKLFFTIGDVSGKGVPAALFMVIIKILLKTEALRNSTPDKILYNVNNIIAADNDSCMFATIFCAILNTETGELEFSNAGHNPPLLCKNKQKFELIALNQGFLLGPMPEAKFFLEKLILNPSDTIFLYTDGVNEAMNPERKQFSEKRLQEQLNTCKNQKITDLINNLRKDIKAFVKTEPQSDDITMLAVQYREGT